MSPGAARSLFDGLMIGGILGLATPIIAHHARHLLARRRLRKDLDRWPFV